MERTIDRLGLDLSGMVVLTEAATRIFAVTAPMAALAGADRVWAVAADTAYGSAAGATETTRLLARSCGVESRLSTSSSLSTAILREADIVTNLGSVRPLDAARVRALKRTAVIALMCEAWELRPGDIDVEACRSHGVPVLGTNEDHPAVDVWRDVGMLAVRLLLDAQIEVRRSDVLVVSSDAFGPVITEHLASTGARARLTSTLREVRPDELGGVDALLVADYTRDDEIIGADGDMTVADVAAAAPSLVVVQVAGRVDVSGLMDAGVTVSPPLPLPAHRMASTLAAIGPRPVIELHGAGLRVGQWGVSLRRRGIEALDVLGTGGDELAQPVRTGAAST